MTNDDNQQEATISSNESRPIKDSSANLTAQIPTDVEATQTSDSKSAVTIAVAQNIVTRDTEYYFYDGSCIILVEDRLFRIQRSLLERDSPFFQTLFSLPQDSNQSSNDKVTSSTFIGEGNSDDSPVVCHDSSDDFRALCWALYARPPEIISQHARETVDLPRMIRVLAMAHKYQFEALQKWAIDVIGSTLDPGHSNLASQCESWENVGRLLDLSRICKQEALALGIERQIINQIRGLKADYYGFKTFISVLGIPEGIPSLRRFHGKVYHAFLGFLGVFARTQSRKSSDSPLVVGDITSYFDNIFSNPNLKEKHRLRIYQGSWSLTQLGRRLLVPPKIEIREGDNPLCPDDIIARKEWWDVTINPSKCSVDPIVIVEKLHQNMPQSLKDKVCDSCYRTFRSQIVQIQRTLEETLADHFGISYTSFTS